MSFSDLVALLGFFVRAWAQVLGDFQRYLKLGCEFLRGRKFLLLWCSWGPLGALEASWTLLWTPGRFCALMAALGHSWVFLGALGAPELWRSWFL